MMTDFDIRDRAVGLCLLATLAAGCATSPREAPRAHPAWPAPPAQPRIVHRTDIAGEDDVRKPGFFQNLGRAIAGQHGQKMLRPHAAAVDRLQRLYVTDQELQGVHVLDLKSGRAGFIARVGDKFLVSPVGVAACEDVVAISDSALNAVYLLSPQGKLLRTIQKPGGFERPTGLAWNAPRRELYVVDTLARQVCVFNLEGQMLRAFGSLGVEPGQFNFPTHVFVADDGLVYVTDSLNFRVQAFDTQGQYRFDVGQQGDASGHLGVPKGVAVDGHGHIYVVDSYFGTVQIFDRAGRFLLHFGEPGRGWGQFEIPAGITIGPDGRIYVCDSFNHRVQVFEYVGGPADEDIPTDE